MPSPTNSDQPSTIQSAQPSVSRHALRRWAFALSALEGVVALVFLASLPSDADAGRWLGFSTARLLLMALMVVLAAGAGFAAWASGRPAAAARLEKASTKWLTLELVVEIIAGFLSLVLPQILLSLYRTSGEFRYLAYAQRLQPLFIWSALTFFQLAAAVIFAGGLPWQALRQQKSVFQAALAAWACFFLAALFSMLTGIGLLPDVIGWGRPAVALLEWQVGLAWAAGVVLLLFGLRFRLHARIDWLIAALIWLTAAGVWLAQPVQPAFFATQGRAPNYEIYPFSDGAYYGTFAQSLLVGGGFKGSEIPPRPLYITLLAGFHAVGGQRYENIIALQTLLLAFFPVILYLLGKELHSRPAGLAAALLAVLRELTAIISAPFTDNASNSQLLFADLPTALAIALWLLIVVRWFKTRFARPLDALIVGGGIGLVMLFRTQSMFLIPAVLLLALFTLRFRWKVWLRSVVLLALGLILVISPWLWRNWEKTGQLAFDDPKSQTGSMAARYSLSGTDESTLIRPGEDVSAYSQRVSGSIFRFLSTHPDVVAGFVTAHFFNAEIANVLVLPLRDGIASPLELWLPSTAFWEQWDGSLTAGQGLLFAFYLALAALGVGSGWARLGWAGLLPLFTNLSYNLSMSLARNSGGRYLLAVDWVVYFYAALGMIEIALAVLSLAGVSWQRISAQLAVGANEAGRVVPLSSAWPTLVKAGLALVLVGAILPLAEQMAPVRYPRQEGAALLAEAEDTLGDERADLEAFMTQPGAMVTRGRALYPRYYDAGDGEPRTAKTGYEPLDYGRLLFQMVSPSFNGLVMLRSQVLPEYFPNAADVLVVGCFTSNASGGVIDAALVIVEGDVDVVYSSDGGWSLDCSSISSSRQ